MDTSVIEKHLRRPSFFVLRSALLPFDAFAAWSEGVEAARHADDTTALEFAFRSDRLRLRERLSTIASMPEVREALYVASPEFHRALDQWNENPDDKKGRRAERTLVRYFARMCGRSTPFGLFAGYSLAIPADRTYLRLENRQTNRRHVRLDMDYLGSLVETLAKEPDLQEVLGFRPNSSIHRIGGQMRYAESRVTGKGRSYHLVAAEETEYLLETLQRAESGATLFQLAEALVGDEVSSEDAAAYIRELIATQLLVPELAPRATGLEPIHDLLFQLRPHPRMTAVVERLDEVQRVLEAMDVQAPGIDVGSYGELADKLADLPVKVDPSKLFQVDLLKCGDQTTVADDVVEEVARAVLMLHGLRQDPRNDDLSAFREQFRERYENREVPLLEVLDEENGIGFGANTRAAEVSPLLEGLGVPLGNVGRRIRQDDSPRWTSLQTFLLDKLTEMQGDDSLVLRLEPEEVERFKSGNPMPLPDSFHVIAEIAAASPEALQAGHFQVAMQGASGPSGAVMLGRFCHGDPALLGHVKQHLADEESLRPDVIFAEIVHLPEGRVGNVILRPALRRYEIPYLGRAAVDDGFQVPVSDLLVSIRGQSITLRSRRLGNEVVPRLTSAHNFRRSALNVYRFLGALQRQDTAQFLGWSWGDLASARFLPRVVVGKVVLSRAEWRVARPELSEAIDAQDAKRFAAAQRWRKTRRLPRFVLVADGDNKLPIDLDNVLSVDTLIELVKKRREFRLEELYPQPQELGVSGPEGRFVHELIVPFLVQREPSAPVQTRTAEVTTPIRRGFPPGSEWLYAKIYTGTGSVDGLLWQAIAPLSRRLLSDGSIDGWFFIRYGDPDWHLRVRFHGDPRHLAGEVLPRLETAVARQLESGLVWKIQLDTYEREIERYGRGEDMLLAERLFQYDSEAALEILEMYSGDAFADTRWRLALRGIDQLLDDLGFDPERKNRVILASRTSHFEELHAPPTLEHRLGERFRKERGILHALLDRANDETSAFAEGLSALHRRSAKLRPVTSALSDLAKAGRLSVSLESLAASYVHMHVNRVLRSAHRAQELVLYDFLARIYKSQRARAASS